MLDHPSLLFLLPLLIAPAAPATAVGDDTAGGEPGIVHEVSGRAAVWAAPGGELVAVAVGQALLPGQEMVTGSDGAITVRFGSVAELVVGPSSRGSCRRVGDEPGVTLHAGSVWLVRGQRGGLTLGVHDDTSISAEVGTRIEVAVHAGSSTVTVYDGDATLSWSAGVLAIGDGEGAHRACPECRWFPSTTSADLARSSGPTDAIGEPLVDTMCVGGDATAEACRIPPAWPCAGCIRAWFACTRFDDGCSCAAELGAEFTRRGLLVPKPGGPTGSEVADDSSGSREIPGAGIDGARPSPSPAAAYAAGLPPMASPEASRGVLDGHGAAPDPFPPLEPPSTPRASVPDHRPSDDDDSRDDDSRDGGGGETRGGSAGGRSPRSR